MRRILILILLPVQSLFAQGRFMPFELERMSAAHYSSEIAESDTVFDSELEALTYYYLAYKIQRAENPASYFPPADAFRKYASHYLNTNYAKGSGVALVNFLESSGNHSSCLELLHSNSNYKLLLPYRFIAAELTQNKEKAREALIKMDSEEMLSPVLKNFGKNAVASFGNKKIIITQGIQDLIAVRYALKANSKIVLYNLFLQQCNGYTAGSQFSAIQSNSEIYWFSPAIDFAQLDFRNAKMVQGIGFTPSVGLSDDLTVLNPWVGVHFFGLDDKPKSPADRGLISSYRYFSKAFTAYSDQFGSKKEMKAARAIHQFVRQSDK